jgi:hypothetical protein
MLVKLLVHKGLKEKQALLASLGLLGQTALRGLLDLLALLGRLDLLGQTD